MPAGEDLCAHDATSSAVRHRRYFRPPIGCWCRGSGGRCFATGGVDVGLGGVELASQIRAHLATLAVATPRALCTTRPAAGGACCPGFRLRRVGDRLPATAADAGHRGGAVEVPLRLR